MQISLQFLSNNDGKSILLRCNEKKYFFNMFEGFQRMAVEKKISVSSVDCIFLNDVYSLSGYLGYFFTYFTKKKISYQLFAPNIETNLDFIDISNHNLKNDIYFNDKYINVTRIFATGTVSYLIKFIDYEGQLNVNMIPPEIPKYLYKDLKKCKLINYNEQTYNGSDYCSQPISIPSILLVFSLSESNSLNRYVTENMLVVVMQEELRAHFPETSCYVFSSSPGYFPKAIDSMKSFNTISSAYRIPEVTYKSKDTNQCIYTGDVFSFNKNKNFILIPDEPKHTFEYKDTYSFTGSNVLFLGTGGALPSRIRNVSGIMYESQNDAMLLDPGEDTFGQIQQIYGSTKILDKVKIIYISHFHADHFLGIANILKNTFQPLTIIGPSSIKFYAGLFSSKISYIEIENVFSLNSDSFNVSGFEITLKESQHCQGSSLLRFKHENVTVTYSGDTRPTRAFIDLARHADLMIHETTYLDKDIDDAIENQHSTISEAIAQYKQAEAKACILTHFSQKIDSIEFLDIFNEIAQNRYCCHNLFLAFDFFCYKFNK